MKKLILILLAGHITLFSSGCAQEENNENVSIPKEDSFTEEAAFSENDETADEVSKTPPEEIYDFLKSEYKVVSKREAFETVYVCEYYFIEGTVAGAKLMTTFPTESNAIDYYETVAKDYANAEIDGLTVTLYSEDNGDYYYGYTLEKLKFVLEKADYEVHLEFDEAIFEEELSKTEESK